MSKKLSILSLVCFAAAVLWVVFGAHWDGVTCQYYRPVPGSGPVYSECNSNPPVWYFGVLSILLTTGVVSAFSGQIVDDDKEDPDV